MIKNIRQILYSYNRLFVWILKIFSALNADEIFRPSTNVRGSWSGINVGAVLNFTLKDDQLISINEKIYEGPVTKKKKQ